MTPHLTVPFRVDSSGSAAVVEQDSFDDISQCVRVLLLTRLGERIELPAYGVPDQVLTMEGNLDAGDITARIETWEPRTKALVDSEIDALEESVRRLSVRLETEGEPQLATAPPSAPISSGVSPIVEWMV
jgi:phage baseplate assembly protein W